MNIKFVLLTSLFLVTVPCAFASETGPSKPVEELGICVMCQNEMTLEQLRTDLLIDSQELFGCAKKHLFHRNCALDEYGKLKTVRCPLCRATKDPHAVDEERAALGPHYGDHYPQDLLQLHQRH